jgi:hypothetical protein
VSGDYEDPQPMCCVEGCGCGKPANVMPKRFSWSEVEWVEIEPDPQAGQLLEALAALDRMNDTTPPGQMDPS